MCHLPVLVGVFSDRRFCGFGLSWFSRPRPQDHLRRRRSPQETQDAGICSILEEQEERAYHGRVYQGDDGQEPRAGLPLHSEISSPPCQCCLHHPLVIRRVCCGHQVAPESPNYDDVMMKRYKVECPAGTLSRVPAASSLRALTPVGSEQAFRAIVSRRDGAYGLPSTSSPRRRVMLKRHGMQF
jgi:hypothetical protein